MRQPDIFESKPQEDLILSKILELIFTQLDDIWSEYELNLFPYVKSVKGLTIIDDVIKNTQKNNLDNVFTVLSSFFKGE